MKPLPKPLPQENIAQKSNIPAILLGILASILVAIPIVPATFFIFFYGVLGGTATMGGPGAAAQPNTEWWALPAVLSPLLALAIIVSVGVGAGKYAYYRQTKKHTP